MRGKKLFFGALVLQMLGAASAHAWCGDPGTVATTIDNSCFTDRATGKRETLGAGVTVRIVASTGTGMQPAFLVDILDDPSSTQLFFNDGSPSAFQVQNGSCVPYTEPVRRRGTLMACYGGMGGTPSPITCN